MNRKLKAFTLMELIIGMIISSLVVVIGGSAFRLVSLQLSEYKNTNNKIQDWSTAEFLLKKEIGTAKTVRKLNENSFEVVLKDGKVIYKVRNGNLLRQREGVTDTFRIQVADVVMSFENKIQDKENGLIDKIAFELEQSGAKHTYTVVKQYDSDVLMREEAG